MIGRYRRHVAFRVLGLAALAAFVATFFPGGVLIRCAVAAAADDLAQAREHYEFAEFQQALDICNGLIAGGTLAGAELRDAYVLKARCLVNLGNHSIARDMFCEALKVEPSWRPEANVLPKDEQEDFDRALAGCRLALAPPATPAPAPAPTPTWQPPPAAKSGGKSFFAKPLGIAVIVLGVGGLAAALGGGGGGGETTPPAPLAGFPLPPETVR